MRRCSLPSSTTWSAAAPGANCRPASAYRNRRLTAGPWSGREPVSGVACTKPCCTGSTTPASSMSPASSSTPRTSGPKKGGEHTGPSPVDRGKPDSKMHILSDANGLPLLVGVSAGNTHDSEGLKPMIDGHQTRHDPHRGRVLQTAAPARGQSLRPRRPAQMAAMETHRSTHRPQGHRIQRTIRATPLGHRADHVLALRLPSTQPPLRTQSP